MKSALKNFMVKLVSYLYRNSIIPVNNPVHLLKSRALERSADYIEKNIQNAQLFLSREELWSCASKALTVEGLNLEFGVNKGESIRYIAALSAFRHRTIVGFDSFEGLRESWPGTRAMAGHFDQKGKIPTAPSNVSFEKGWFESSLPSFLSSNPGSVRFLHLDADTYESTALVLRMLTERLVSGSVLVFDEYHGYVNWEKGEFLAWQEFCQEQKIEYDYLAFGPQQAAVRIS